MLMKKLSGSDRDGTRRLLPGETVTTVSVAQDAANALKITAQDLHQLRVIDAIVPEPMGGAHRAPLRCGR